MRLSPRHHGADTSEYELAGLVYRAMASVAPQTKSEDHTPPANFLGSHADHARRSPRRLIGPKLCLAESRMESGQQALGCGRAPATTRFVLIDIFCDRLILNG
jgi:hypothetical protein